MAACSGCLASLVFGVFGLDRPHRPACRNARRTSFQRFLRARVGGVDGAGLVVGLDFQPHAQRDIAADPQFLDCARVAFHLVRRCDRQRELRPLGQRLADRLELLLFRRQQGGRAEIEFDGFELVGTDPQQAAERAERRGHQFGQHVDDGFPDDLAVAELRIVETR